MAALGLVVPGDRLVRGYGGQAGPGRLGPGQFVGLEISGVHAAVRRVSEACSKRCRAGVTLAAFRPAPRDPASSEKPSITWVSELFAVRMPTLGVSASILAECGVLLDVELAPVVAEDPHLVDALDALDAEVVQGGGCADVGDDALRGGVVSVRAVSGAPDTRSRGNKRVG